VTTPADRVVVRARHGPRFLRWAIGFQLGLASFVGSGFVIEGVWGRGWMPVQAVVNLGALTGVSGLLATGITFGRRNTGAAEISPKGIRPLDPRNFHRWECVGAVRVKAGPFANRWLEVVPNDAPPFVLTARASDPDALLDSLERFAGPDHPLTRAYATLNHTS
jgi:hypothetical protein